MELEIEKELLSMQDIKYKEFQKGICPGVDYIIGIRIPILRSYAKELIKRYDFKYLMENIPNNYYEEIMLQGMLIGQAKLDFNKIIKYIKDFIPKINNWAVCDTFCTGLKITKNNKEKMWDFMQDYIKSDKEFYIRFGIVMILNYYIDEDYLYKDFKIFDSINSDKYYVQMGVAWAISYCLIKFYDKTVEYLKNTKIDKFTYNKSIQKAIESFRISKEQKDYLRTLKR